MLLYTCTWVSLLYNTVIIILFAMFYNKNISKTGDNGVLSNIYYLVIFVISHTNLLILHT